MVRAQRSAARTAALVPVLAVAGIAVLVVVAAATGGEWTISTVRGPFPSPVEESTRPPSDLANDASTPELPVELIIPFWLTIVFWAALALLAGGVGFALWRRHRRRPIRPADDTGIPLPGDPLPDVRRLHEGAMAALDLLDAGGDPRDAVVRAWTSLEVAAERSGVPRDPSDTPSEFTAVVLQATAADPHAVRELLDLYHRARFSTHPVGLAEVTAARACVLALSRTWRRYDDALRASAS